MLIAMSGVRIVNPELRALGLTLPGFVERGKVIASMPSLGLLTIAGATPPHWEVSYHEIDDLDQDSLAELVRTEPDLVAVSSLSARVEDAYRVLGDFRAAGVSTVLGGLHASVMPEEASVHADCVVTGQGEWVWPKLIRDFESGALASRYDGMHAREPLASTPLPRYDLLDPERYNRIPLQTTRGCPLDCAFCAASRLISPYKRKPIERIREEVESVLQIWNQPFIELADDNTFVNKPWGRALADLFAEYPQIRWFTETDISLGDDEELISRLARSGCAQVLVGLESVQDDSLAEADTRSWKRKRRREYIERVRRIQDGGISVNGCFVFGFDADTHDTFDRTWDFIQEAELSEVQVTLLTPFPGTALYDSLARQGRLLKDRFWNQCTLFDVTFGPRGLSPVELERRFQKMVATVYSDDANERRRTKRASIYRHRRTATT
ncbi:MAG: hypothetical protein HONBIEJF_01066 [Fimbriimonadaceae bacterium]|nr:hypothetical protein [Fimbriimonadaceae bacterium]